MLRERAHLVAEAGRGPDRRRERLAGAVLPAAGDGDELVGAAAQLVADVVDDQVDIALATDDARQDLARHVNMAEDYLTSCFHKEVGMAPIAYLNRYRVNQAKLLLKQGEASITDIALAVGFVDRGYFSRVFRREVGMSPEAYRREQVS